VSSVQHHVIRREILDVALTGTEVEGFALQSRLSALCRDWLGPAIEDALSRSAPEDEHWTIERLEIDAGAFGIDTLERDFAGAVAGALGRQLRDRFSGQGGDPQRSGDRTRAHSSPATPSRAADDDEAGATAIRRTHSQSLWDAFIHFLQTGSLPWWYHLPAGRSLETALVELLPEIETSARTSSVWTEALAFAAVRTRLVRQFSPSFLKSLLVAQAPAMLSTVHTIAAGLERQPLSPDVLQIVMDHLWASVFAVVASRRPFTDLEFATVWIQAVQAEPRLGDVPMHALEAAAPAITPSLRTQRRDAAEDNGIAPISLPTGQRSEALRKLQNAPLRNEASSLFPNLEEGEFVDCAGTVLLHPFLPALFERLDVATQSNLNDPDRAMALLHYLATGERRAPEYALVFAKLLCGMPLDAATGAPAELPDADIAEADSLLAAVIAHWTALGEASPDALRGTFLTRPGKLSRRGGDDLLQVEAHSFDVLLDKLPWGMGVVQLPWMPRMLWVEWRK